MGDLVYLTNVFRIDYRLVLEENKVEKVSEIMWVTDRRASVKRNRSRKVDSTSRDTPSYEKGEGPSRNH